MSTFKATHEWQAVPEGAVLPPGCQVEVDMATGKQRARIPPGNGAQGNGSGAAGTSKAAANEALIKAFAASRKAGAGGSEPAATIDDTIPLTDRSGPELVPVPADWTDPVFHGPLGEMVRTLDPYTEASALGTMTSLLVMMGNSLGRSYYVPIGAGRHFPVIYAWMVGPSATGRKGTAADNALFCMGQIDPDWCAYNIRRSLNSGQGIVQTVKNLHEEARNRTQAASLLSGGAAEVGHGLDDKRALFLIAELGDVLTKAGGEGNTLYQTLRDVWDNGHLENTSVTRPMRVEGASVSMLGMITAEELVDMLDLKQLATGSLNRVNLIAVQRSKILPGFPPILDSELIKPVAEHIKQNLVACRDALPFGHADGIRHPIVLSDEAAKLAIKVKVAKEKQGKTWIETGSARAFVQVLRLALIYAVVDGMPEIEPVHLNAAESFIDHAERTLAILTTGELKDVLAQRILTHMRESPREVLSRTEISVNVFRGHVDAAKLEGAIRLLIRLGLMTEVVVPTKGRPRTVYRLA